MAIRIATALTLIAFAAAPGPAMPDPARMFLMTAFHLSTADIARLDRGEVFSRTVEAKNRREVATLGIARIDTSPLKYIERLTDITTFKRTDDVLQIGKFSNVPRPADLEPLSIENADLRRLRECHVDDCDLKLPATTIERVRHEIDWHAADASSKASLLLRQLLGGYVARYVQTGTAAEMEYADRAPRLNVAREFASLMDADTIAATYAPRLRRHLLQYPAQTSDTTTDFVYWSKELVRGRPVISITHVATVAAGNDSPVAYAIGSKQIYAMHYFDASLGLTLLVPDTTAASPATFVVYLNRSRIDLLDGFLGTVARRLVAGRARGVVADQLLRLQRVLAADPAQPGVIAR